MAVNDEERYLVDEREEIIRVLRALVADRAPLSAYFNDGNDILLTVLLAVLPEDEALIVDCNANAASNAALLASQRAQFVSAREGATVKWLSERIEQVEFEGRPAFRLPFPATIRRIQRRGAYRVATPVGHPVCCRVRLPDGATLDLTLTDICADGIGIVVANPAPEVLQLGARFDEALIELPEVGSVHVALIVQGLWESEAATATGAVRKRTHAGLAFVGIRPPMQALVQRYVNKLDRARIAALPRH